MAEKMTETIAVQREEWENAFTKAIENQTKQIMNYQDQYSVMLKEEVEKLRKEVDELKKGQLIARGACVILSNIDLNDAERRIKEYLKTKKACGAIVVDDAEAAFELNLPIEIVDNILEKLSV